MINIIIFQGVWLILYLKKGYKERAEVFRLYKILPLGQNNLIKDFWMQNIKEEGLSLPAECNLNSLIEKYFSYFVMKDLMEGRKNGLLRQIKKNLNALMI